MADVRWLDEKELAAWRALAGVLFTLPAALDSQLQRDADLSLGDYMVLALLSEQEGAPLRMSELAAISQTSQSRLSRIVARLELAGYVTRSMTDGDRRVVVTHLTEAGLAKIVATAPGHLEAVRSLVIDRLTPAQVEAMGEIMRAILAASPSSDQASDACVELEPGAGCD